MGKPIVLITKDIIGSDSAISTDDGDKLFKRVKKALDNNAKVTISFKNISLITSAFLNASIGQLYGHFDSTFLNKHLTITDIQTPDLDTLKLVIERAKDYFKNQDGITSIIDKELDRGN